MRKHLVCLILLGFVCAPALAYELATSEPVNGFAGTQWLQGGQTRADIVYSNTTAVAGYSAGLDTWIDDDLYLGPGERWLNSACFTVYNSSASTLPLSTVDIQIGFWDIASPPVDPDPIANALGVLDFGTVAVNLDPGYYTVLCVNDLYAAGVRVLLPDAIWGNVLLTNPTGGATAIGQIIAGNPPAIGTSDDLFYMYPPGGYYWFGGDPYANFYWEIDTIPEPATLLLVVGACALIRRR